MKRFWRQHPALLLGLWLLLGTAYGLNPEAIYLWLGGILFLTCPRWPYLLALSAAVVLVIYRSPPKELSTPHHGTGVFTIDRIHKSQSPFQSSWIYSGRLKQFTDDSGQVFPSVACQIYAPSSTSRRSPARAYQITGTLKDKNFRCDKGSSWQPVGSPIPQKIVAWRYHLRSWLDRYLTPRLKDPQVRHFLEALFTGDVEDPSLRLAFNHLGLQHILAISGFHFALIAYLLRSLLRPFFSARHTAFTLLALLTLYYLFVGPSPSVQRAYLAISLFLVGMAIGRPITPLNALGAGLCIEILWNPFHLHHLGFSLSFLCTCFLLLLYPLTRDLMGKWLPPRTADEVRAMPRLHQHGFVASAFLRQNLSVTLAILLPTLPVLLFLFHRFPCLSLIYNLFFPYLVSVSLLLLCLSLLLPIPIFSDLLHAINNGWTQMVLTLTEHPPAYLDVTLRCASIPYEGLLLYLMALFLVGVWYNQKEIVFLNRQKPALSLSSEA